MKFRDFITELYEGKLSETDYLYMLDGHTAIPAPDVLTWARWFENQANRQLFLDKVGEAMISTVFLGVSVTDPPVLFETLVIGGKFDHHRQGYLTWDEAAAGHAAVVEQIKGKGH